MTADVLQTLRCKNCGGDVPITSPATISVTCPHCDTLSLRADIDLETIGKVALPAPLRSAFRIGTEGRFDGQAFVVRGQIQLDHGAGLWNEWAAETDDGWIWIAEAQGQIQIYREVPVGAGDVPTREMLPDTDPETGNFVATQRPDRDSQWRAGDWVEVDGDRWQIKEIGRGRVVTFRGESPVRMNPGTRTTYLDLTRGASQVATLDFTRPAIPEFLSGRTVDLDELMLDPSTQPDDVATALESERVRCTNCGGAIEVQDPERALTLGCVHCGTMLQRGSHLDAYHAVEVEERIKTVPDLPIGSKARLRGEDVTVLGYLRRGVFDDGQFWPWSEYLLRTDSGQYRWLVESDGHWVLASPVAPTRVARKGRVVKVGDIETRPFSTGHAVVDTVLGEFYWQVARGESVDATDFVHPPTGHMVSIESSPFEFSTILGRHVDRDEIAEAFPDARLPKVSGVGPVQPSPYKPGKVWRAFVVMLILLTGSCVAVRAKCANEVVHDASYGPTPPNSSEENVEFSDPFTIEEDGANLQVRLAASTVDQGYVDVLGALVNEATGDVTTFTVAAQRYSGYSGGESWTEGNRRGSALLGAIPAGDYRLRIASRGYDRGVNTPFQLTLRSEVPRKLWFILALLALLVYPIVVAIKAAAFETKRWSKSDFGGTG